MGNSLKDLIRLLVPPALLRKARQFRSDSIRFEGECANWKEACEQCSGYDSEGILDKVLAATLKVKHGEAAFERDSVTFDEHEYAWPVLTGLMWAAARNRGCLKVLDYGGALGSSYFQNHHFLLALPEVRWNVVEQGHFVEAGQAYIQDEYLKFYRTTEDCRIENNINVVLLSSVLQYIEDCEDLIDKMVKVKADVIVIDRTIINKSSVNRVYIQRTPASIYSASYPCRSLSESWLIDAFCTEYEMKTDFESLNFPALRSINSYFKGYIFKKAL